MKYHLITLSTAVLGMMFSSCSMPTNRSGALSSYKAYDRPTSLPSNPRNVQVKVSLSKQRAYVMESGKALLVMPVCVGARGTSTPTGNFRIYNKEHKHRANSHGYAYKGNLAKKCTLDRKPAGWSFKGTPMPYWCEFKPNYGFHTGWLKHTPASHGCIRMHENLAPKFYRLVSTGTPVNISNTQAEDASLENISLAPDAGPLPDYPAGTYTGDAYFNTHKSPSYQ